MRHQNISGYQDISKTITSDDVLGKDVIDSEGDFIGIVENLHISPEHFEVIGISVDKGFLKKGLFIGKGYIKRITPHAIFLSIRPAFSIKGMAVFDKEGKKIGIVKEVILTGTKNQIKNLKIRSGILRREADVSAEQIDSIGHSVFLNVLKYDIMQNIEKPLY